MDALCRNSTLGTLGKRDIAVFLLIYLQNECTVTFHFKAPSDCDIFEVIRKSLAMFKLKLKCIWCCQVNWDDIQMDRYFLLLGRGYIVSGNDSLQCTPQPGCLHVPSTLITLHMLISKALKCLRKDSWKIKNINNRISFSHLKSLY